MEHDSNKNKEDFNLGEKTDIDYEKKNKKVRLFGNWESRNSAIIPNYT